MNRTWSRLAIAVMALAMVVLIIGCSSSSFYVRSAKLHINNKNYEEAKEVLEEGSQVPPNDVDPSLWLTKALVHFQLNEWEDMLESANKALELDPTKEKEVADLKQKAWARIASDGVKDFQNSDFLVAADKFELALKMKPGDPETLTNLGLSYFQAGNLEKAAANFEESVAKDKSDQVLRTKQNLLETYRRMEDYEKVVSLASDIIATADSLDDVHKIAIIQNKAMALQVLQRTDEAIAEWDSLLQVDPTNADFAFNKALLLDLLERYNEAAAAYLHAIELNPEDNEARQRAANALLGSQQWETIVKVLEPWLFPDGVKVYDPEFRDLHTWMTLKAAYANTDAPDKAEVVDEILKKISG